MSLLITPSSRAAIAVTILIIEPGGFEDKKARSRKGLFGLLLIFLHFLALILFENSLGLKDGLLTSAKISLVFISCTTAAPLRSPNAL